MEELPEEYRNVKQKVEQSLVDEKVKVQQSLVDEKVKNTEEDFHELEILITVAHVLHTTILVSKDDQDCLFTHFQHPHNSPNIEDLNIINDLVVPSYRLSIILRRIQSKIHCFEKKIKENTKINNPEISEYAFNFDTKVEILARFRNAHPIYSWDSFSKDNCVEMEDLFGSA